MIEVEGTPYGVHAEPVFASPRWRFVVTVPTVGGRRVHVTSSAGTYSTAELAAENGVKYAHALAKTTKEIGTPNVDAVLNVDLGIAYRKPL